MDPLIQGPRTKDPMIKDFCSIHVLARIFIKMTQ